QKRGFFGRLGGRLLDLNEELGSGRRIKQRSQQTINVGPGSFFIEMFRADLIQRNRLAHRSVIFCSLSEEYKSMTRQSLHIFSRSSAGPWNRAWPLNLSNMFSIAFCVPKGVLQRMQWKGCASFRTTVCLRSGPVSKRGTSVIA